MRKRLIELCRQHGGEFKLPQPTSVGGVFCENFLRSFHYDEQRERLFVNDNFNSCQRTLFWNEYTKDYKEAIFALALKYVDYDPNLF